MAALGDEFYGHSVEYAHQGVELHIEFRRLICRILLGSSPLVMIAFRLHQSFADHGCRTQSCHGRSLSAVCIFHPIGEAHLNGDLGHHDHLLHRIASGLDGCAGSADGVCIARTGNGCGHSSGQSHFKALVPGIDGVHGPHLGYDGIGGLVGVVALKPEDLFFDAKGAVRLDDTGSHIVSAGVDDHVALAVFLAGVVTDIKDLSVLYHQILFLFVDSGHVDQITVFDNQHCVHLPFFHMRSFRR